VGPPVFPEAVARPYDRRSPVGAAAIKTGRTMRDDGAERGRVLAEMAAALHRLEIRRSEEEEAGAASPARRRRGAWMRHWYYPGEDTPWWVYGLRLGFWLLIAAGVETAGEGQGWQPNLVLGPIGVAEVAWRARTKIRARRRARGGRPVTWDTGSRR
jgi:hypothetical protein